MTLTQTSGGLKKFKRTVGQFPHQLTIQTPLKKLRPFVDTIVSALQPVRSGRVIIDEVISEPRHINSLLAQQTICAVGPRGNRSLHDWSLDCVGQEGVQELLTAALSDAIDFAFVPVPKVYMIYADHDEYITFFSATASNLNRVMVALSKVGFQPKNFQRRF